MKNKPCTQNNNMIVYMCLIVLFSVKGYFFVSPTGNSIRQERATLTSGGYSFTWGGVASPGLPITKAGRLEAKDELTGLGINRRDTAAIVRHTVLNPRPQVRRNLDSKGDMQLAGYSVVLTIVPSVSVNSNCSNIKGTPFGDLFIKC